MKLEYSLLVLGVGLLYGIIRKFFPDFPVSEEVLLSFLAYVLAKLGVVVTEPAIRGFLVRRGFRGFSKG